MEDRRTILITGAAGNLGSLLSRDLVPTGHELRLMYHRKPLPEDVAHAANVRPTRADLGDPATLTSAVSGADVIVHFAGRLFAPDRALPPETNTLVSNLLTAALHAQVGRIILISFPMLKADVGEQPARAARPAADLGACPDASGRGRMLSSAPGHRHDPGHSSLGMITGGNPHD